jgi:hypothetical protein
MFSATTPSCTRQFTNIVKYATLQSIIVIAEKKKAEPNDPAFS